MTKLLEWLGVLAVVGMVWVAALLNLLLPHFRTEILWSPLILVGGFGVYSVATIAFRCVNHCSVQDRTRLFRVFTFNDCEEAAKELQVEISEAREDLRSKGFNFEDKSVKKTD